MKTRGKLKSLILASLGHSGSHSRVTHMRSLHSGIELLRFYWDRKCTAPAWTCGPLGAFSSSSPTESHFSTESLKLVKFSKFSSVWAPLTNPFGKAPATCQRWKPHSRNGRLTEMRTLWNYAATFRMTLMPWICWRKWCTWSHRRGSLWKELSRIHSSLSTILTNRMASKMRTWIPSSEETLC